MRTPVYSALAGGLVAFAAVGTAAAAQGGMPQLDYRLFAPQLVWLAIAFVTLYLVMSRLAVPAISDTLERRQARSRATSMQPRRPTRTRAPWSPPTRSALPTRVRTRAG